MDSASGERSEEVFFPFAQKLARSNVDVACGSVDLQKIAYSLDRIIHLPKKTLTALSAMRPW